MTTKVELSVNSLVAIGSIDSVLLTWTNDEDGCLSYTGLSVVEVWRDDSGANDRANAIKIADVAGNTYVDEGFSSNQTFYYWVRAKNKSGTTGPWEPTSSTSGEAAQPTRSGNELFAGTPGDVTNLSTANNTGSVEVSWTNPTDAPKEIEVYWATSGSSQPGTPNRIIAGTSTTVTVSDLTNGTTYDFWVQTRNSATEKGNVVGPVSGTPETSGGTDTTVLDDTIPPSAPTNLTATASFRNIFLDWDNPSDDDLKTIQVWVSSSNDRSTAVREGRAPADKNQPSIYVDSGLSTGTTRYYWLTALDYAGNESGFNAGVNGGVSATTAILDEVDFESLTIGSATAFSLAADNVNFGTLDGNQATIINLDAGNITTGTLDANRIDVSNIFIGDLSGAGSLAEQNSVGNNDITSIDGGKITTGTIDANHINAADKLKVGNPGTFSSNFGEFACEGRAIIGSPSVALVNDGSLTLAGDCRVQGGIGIEGYLQLFSTGSVIGITASDVGAVAEGGSLDEFSGGTITTSGTNIQVSGTDVIDLDNGGFIQLNPFNNVSGTIVSGELVLVGFLEYNNQAEPTTPSTDDARVFFDGTNLKIKFDDGSVKNIISK